MHYYCFPVAILLLTVSLKYGKALYCTGKPSPDDLVQIFECPQAGLANSKEFCCGDVNEQFCCDIYQYNSLLFIIFLLIGLVSGIISITFGICYSVKCCPLAKWEIHQGSVIQLPYGVAPGGIPGVRMSAHDMEMMPIAAPPYMIKGYNTQQ